MHYDGLIFTPGFDGYVWSAATSHDSAFFTGNYYFVINLNGVFSSIEGDHSRYWGFSLRCLVR